jgi:hypothetical protein
MLNEMSNYEDADAENAGCPYHGDQLLFAPLTELCHGCISMAIEVAGAAGEHRAHADPRIVLGQRSKEYFADALDYWTAVLLPMRDRGEIPPEIFAQWEADFDSGRMGRDPRVQAFCAEWAMNAAEVASLCNHRLALLAADLEIDEEQARELLRPVAVVREILPVFTYDRMRYCVLFTEEMPHAVERFVQNGLIHAEPAKLRAFTPLPEGAEDVIARLQALGEVGEEALYRLLHDADLIADQVLESFPLSEVVAEYTGEDAEVKETEDALIIRWPEPQATPQRS